MPNVKWDTHNEASAEGVQKNHLITGTITCGANGAVSSFDIPGVTAVARSSAGRYLLTLKDRAIKLRFGAASVEGSAAAATPANKATTGQLRAVTTAPTLASGTSPSVILQMQIPPTAGAASTDIDVEDNATIRVLLILDLGKIRP